MIASFKGKGHGQQSQESFARASVSDQRAPAPARLQVCRILAPTDLSACSEAALDYALWMAKQFGATVILLHVVEPPVAVQGASISSPAVEESSRLMIENSREALALLCRNRMGRVPIETLVRIGRAYSEIADTAKALACDLIVMGTRGAARETATLGGTTNWVVHHAYCPVITIRTC